MTTLMTLVTKFIADVDQYNSDVASAVKTTEKVSSSMSSLSKIAGGVVVAGITAVTGAVVASIAKAEDWGQTLDSVGDVLGTTSEQSAGLAYMAEQLGGDVSQITDSMAKMTAGLFDAKGQLGPTGQAMQNLGINFRDANGHILPATDILQRVADKVGTMPDGLAKTQAMMDIFGKSGKEMGDLLGAAANGGMDQYIQKAKEVGLALSDKEIQNAIDFGKAQQDLDLALQGASVTIGTAFIPAMTQGAQALRDGLANPDLQTNLSKLSDKMGEMAAGSIPMLTESLNTSLEMINELLDIYDRFSESSLGKTITQIDELAKTLSAFNLPLIGMKAGIDSISNGLGTFTTFLERTSNGASGLANALSHVKEWVDQASSALSRMTPALPKWLTPGSPTPLEYGVRGLSAAMKQASEQVMPQFTAQLSMQGMLNPVAGQESSPAVAQPTPAIDIDYNRFGAAVRDALMTSGMAN